MCRLKFNTTACIEIERVTPSWVYSDSEGQKVIHLAEIAEPVFCVTVIENEGAIFLWSGKSYEEAIMNAEEAAHDWNACVYDLVVEKPL